MKQGISKNITTEKGANEFQVRLIKEEGVGLLTTKKEENYLILDSLDYWYDLIQNEFPKKKKCGCKNEWFYVQFNYLPRPQTDDIKQIKMATTCTACGKVSNAITIDIDYSPTHELIEKPITFCANPNIKYKFSELTSYWSGDNLKDFLHFIFHDLKLNVYCWFSQYPDHIRKFEKVSFEKAMQIITVNHQYLNFYFSAQELNMGDYIKLTDNKGVHVKDDSWRREEIIQLAAPMVMAGYGVLYHINFCNQYLDKGNVKDKSEHFGTITSQLVEWLQRTFATKRGVNCFDGKEAYDKFIAKRNAER